MQRSLEDAASHAINGLSGALRSAPDGRSTVVKVDNSRFLAAALSRVSELRGPVVAMIGDAREEFYRDSFAIWIPMIAAHARRSAKPEPTAKALASIRSAALHGMTTDYFVQGLIDRASKSLPTTMALAAGVDMPLKEAQASIRAWRDTQTRNMIGTLISQLVSSQTEASIRAGRDIIDPKYLTDEAKDHGG